MKPATRQAAARSAFIDLLLLLVLITLLLILFTFFTLA